MSQYTDSFLFLKVVHFSFIRVSEGSCVYDGGTVLEILWGTEEKDENGAFNPPSVAHLTNGSITWIKKVTLSDLLL